MGRTRKYLYCDVHRKALHKCKDCVCECFPDLVFPLTGKCRPHNKRLIECAFCSHVLYTKAEGQADRDEGFFHTKRWNATLPLVAGASSTDELDMTPLLEFDDDTSTGALLDSFRFTESGKPPPLPTKPLMFLPDHDGTLLPESKRPRITRGELKGTLCADLTLEEYETLVADLVERKVHYTVYKRTKSVIFPPFFCAEQLNKSNFNKFPLAFFCFFFLHPAFKQQRLLRTMSLPKWRFSTKSGTQGWN